MFAVRRLLGGLGIAGAGAGVVLGFLFVVYALSVMFWSIPISIGFHLAGDPHSWWWACTHWGLLAPFLLG